VDRVARSVLLPPAPLFDRLTDLRLAPGKNDFKHVELANKRAPRVVYMQFRRAD